MKKIPKGFKLSNHILVLTKTQVPVFEKKVLRFMVREFYVFYTKRPNFPEDPESEFLRLNFYCQPKHELSVIYAMGSLFNEAFHHPESCYFTMHGGHTVAKPFPQAYHIDIDLPDFPDEFIETCDNSDNIPAGPTPTRSKFSTRGDESFKKALK